MFDRDTCELREEANPSGGGACPAFKAPGHRGKEPGCLPGGGLAVRARATDRLQPSHHPRCYGAARAVDWASYALWSISAMLFIGLLWRVYTIQFAHDHAAAQSAPAAKGAKVVIDLGPASVRSARLIPHQQAQRPHGAQ
jgi:hypothetical protein